MFNFNIHVASMSQGFIIAQKIFGEGYLAVKTIRFGLSSFEFVKHFFFPNGNVMKQNDIIDGRTMTDDFHISDIIGFL